MPDSVYRDKPRVVIVDVRNGNVYATGENINLPLEGQQAALHVIKTADVLVEVHADTMLVKEGVERGWVTLLTTKSILQMNTEKAASELQARDKHVDDLETGEHPVEAKFARVWDDSVPSGQPVDGGLKGV
jgi:hypothetical protein